MNIATHDAEIKELRQRNRKQGWAIFGLTLALIAANAATIRASSTQRVVVTPATITKPFWVSGDQVSKEYLEQMGGFVAWLVLDVTPISINWKKESLLSLTSPEAHGRLKIRQEIEADRLKKLNASTDFVLQRLTPDVATNSVILAGRLSTTINGKEVSDVSKSYTARFDYTDGRFEVKGFEENLNEKQSAVAAGFDPGRSQ